MFTRGAFTRGPRQRGVRRSGAVLRRYRLALGLCVAVGSGGCLQVLGGVDVEGASPIGTRQDVLGEFPVSCADAGAGPCTDACQPAQFRCDGDLLEVCAATGKAWDLLAPCATRGLCDAMTGVCQPPACDARQYDCSETGDLLLCNADRTGFDFVKSCTSRAFCNSVRGQEGCEGVVCNAGDQRCNGAQLEACRPDQMGYSPVLPACISAALCKVDAPGQAHCEPPTCVAGQYACNGRELRLCNQDSSGWVVMDRCVSAPLCNVAAKVCDSVACQLGQQRCAGSVLERCNTDQTDYARVVDCVDPLLCDVRVMSCLTMPAPTPSPAPAPPAPAPALPADAP